MPARSRVPIPVQNAGEAVEQGRRRREELDSDFDGIRRLYRIRERISRHRHPSESESERRGGSRGRGRGSPQWGEGPDNANPASDTGQSLRF